MIDTFRSPCRSLALAFAFAVLGGCATLAEQATEPSLYDRLGGKPAITAVVDEFVANIGADDRINHFFAETDIAKLKQLLVEQICAGTGGPRTYTGRDMQTTHAGMKITDAAFDATGEALVKALNHFSVAQAEQDELMGILGSMKADIVGG